MGQRADRRKRLLTVRGEPLADDRRHVVLERIDVADRDATTGN